jgi:hypothetical protein
VLVHRHTQETERERGDAQISTKAFSGVSVRIFLEKLAFKPID